MLVNMNVNIIVYCFHNISFRHSMQRG